MLHKTAMMLDRITRRQWLMGLVCFGLAGGLAVGDELIGGVGEFQVKAVFLYNFTQFTEWPNGTFSASNAPLVIGIVGEDPFGDTMDKLVRGEVVRGHPLVVKRLRPDEDVRSCQVLFISRSEKARLPELLDKLKGSPVLTMGDFEGFAQQGGMVNLLLVNKSVKMEINSTAAEQAGLRISGKVLSLASIVKPK